ncbi:unnamed protein product [Lactuca virosa]|uniref:Uncharacterized protein n=1 Tax=Lactuca virosa TaxID=75947 RepID=A0AAU9MV17_9ASTR|nr:unnamed protein product [Lactuca virosa]
MQYLKLLVDQNYPNKTLVYTGDFRSLLQHTSAGDSRLISGLPSNLAVAHHRLRCPVPPPSLPHTTISDTPGK